MRWTGQDVSNAGVSRNTGQDRRATNAYSVVIVFKSVYSLLLFFLP